MNFFLIIDIASTRIAIDKVRSIMTLSIFEKYRPKAAILKPTDMAKTKREVGRAFLNAKSPIPNNLPKAHQMTGVMKIIDMISETRINTSKTIPVD